MSSATIIATRNDGARCVPTGCVEFLACLRLRLSAITSSAPQENVGRPVRFLVTNRAGQSRWIQSRIVDYSDIRTSDQVSDRYFVRLRLRLQGLEQTVTATLNDRREMRYPLLIGRNFLRNNFVVDVSRDVDDVE